jgi:hypothetical protein
MRDFGSSDGPSPPCVDSGITQRRCLLLGTTAMSIAAAQIGLMDSAAANPGRETKRGANTSFKSLKQINAGLLDVGYAEEGPENGTPVILLHGWPYDIHSYVDVVPLLRRRAIG